MDLYSIEPLSAALVTIARLMQTAVPLWAILIVVCLLYLLPFVLLWPVVCRKTEKVAREILEAKWPPPGWSEPIHGETATIQEPVTTLEQNQEDPMHFTRLSQRVRNKDHGEEEDSKEAGNQEKSDYRVQTYNPENFVRKAGDD